MVLSKNVVVLTELLACEVAFLADERSIWWAL